MAETLYFHIPLIGNVSAELHNESAQIYQWLQATGEVERLKRLDHLGAIRMAWEGAHHPRWEYIAFILALVDRCKCCLPEVHIGSEVKIADSLRISSGSELLKSWTLLLNVGHLEWTFFSERALLLELWAKNKRGCDQRQELLNSFRDDQPLQKWAESILERGDTYRFFQILAFVRLNNLANQSPAHVDWKKILRAYVLEYERQSIVSRLQQLYRNLRRIAYMTLDPHYTPAVLQLDATQLFSDPYALGRLLAMEQPVREDPLMAIERYLYENIYLAEPVIRCMATREANLRQKIRESLCRDGLIKTIEDLARGKLQEEIESVDLTTVVRLSIAVEPSFKRIFLNNLNPRTEQKRLESRLPRDAQSQSSVSVWPSADGSLWIVQFHAPRNHDDRVKVYCLAFEYVVQLRQKAEKVVKLLGDEGLQKLFFERLACELILRALDLLTGAVNQLRWEWVPSSGGMIAVFGTTKSARSMIKMMMKRALLDAEKAELQGKLLLLCGRQKRYVAMSIGRLEGYQKQERLCELDGCMIEVKENEVIVTIIEVKSSKNKKKGRSQAHKDLKEKLNKLGLHYEVSIKSEVKDKVAIAWASIVLPKGREDE